MANQQQLNKQLQKAQERKDKVGKKLIAALAAASELTMEYYDACYLAGDPIRNEGDDARLLLKENMDTYRRTIECIHGK